MKGLWVYSHTDLKVFGNEENNRNKKRYSNNTSGYKGVYYYDHLAKWIGHVCVLDKRYSTKTFETAEACAQAVAELREKLHGAFTNHGNLTEEDSYVREQY